MSSFNKMCMIVTVAAAITSIQTINAQQFIAHKEESGPTHRDDKNQFNQRQENRNHERNRNDVYNNRHDNRVVPIPVNNQSEGVILNDPQQPPQVEINVSPNNNQ